MTDGPDPAQGTSESPSGPWRPGDPHDSRLVDNVAPVDWAVPQAASMYDMVVLGGGAAGLVTAASAAGLGARVALIEETGLGGDCLLTGCVPSKALLAAAKHAHAIRTAAAFGLRADGGLQVDFEAVMERLRQVRADLSPADSVERFTGLGVDVFQGHGSFVGPDRIAVGSQVLRFKSAVVATGGRAVLPPIPGLAAADFLTHSTVFNLTELPASMLVLGAGPMGCELAQAFSRLGTSVVLVESGPGVLSSVDPEAATVVAGALAAEGVQVRVSATVDRIETSAPGVSVWMAGTDAPERFDALLVACGRAPVVDGLGLEAAGVESDPERGVHVDAKLRTTNPRIWAAGDCAMSARFTHVADASARIVVQNALFPVRRTASSLIIPRCVYTDPEVAEVGWSEADLVARDIPHESLRVAFSEVDRACIDGRSEGYVRVWLRQGTDRILGATVVGEGAGDLIGTLSLAITHDVGLAQFSMTVFPYPSRAEILRKLGDAWRRKGLSRGAKKALEVWFSL